MAEEYAHFLVECKSDFDNAAFWHYSALQLQDGKVYRYDTASLNFLHIFPEYAAKVISKSNISTMDDLDVKAKEDALGQLVEHPRLRLEYQRAISNHLTFALPLILVLSIIKFLAFWILWTVLAMYFTGLFSGTVTRIHLIKNTSDIGEATTLAMLSFAF
ncbi:hypothetical protein TVAGG3_0273670 [Trichomonas vaginalis G3]|nr:hypothetical protein TVAGG3_0273670 [Trichomonas vaginalis G3]KAI5526048.1 hypothetical protein TVAGG3_0273670 [Trichomonas vaginalis G3]